MEKFEALNNGFYLNKKKVIIDIKRNNKLLIISYFIIILLLVFSIYIYFKYTNLLEKYNQLESNFIQSSKSLENRLYQIQNITIQTTKDSENHSEIINSLIKALDVHAENIDNQIVCNKNLNKKVQEIENEIEIIKLNLSELEVRMDELNKNEIICKYEIKDSGNEILLFNYEDGMNSHPDWNNKKEIEENIDIYFEGKKLEMNNRFNADKPGIYTIKLKFKKMLKSIRKLFYDCKNLISVDMTNLISNNLLDISYLFSNCINLKEIKGIIKLDSVVIQNMEHLFSFCENLRVINGLNKLITYNVYYMNNMFDNCKSLEFLDLSDFDTSNVITLKGIFKGCESLKSIKGLNNFNTKNVLDFSEMFSSCSSLTSLDVSNFNTSKANDLSFMFNKCINLKEFKGLDKLETNNVVNFSGMFCSCSNLIFLDLTNFKTEKANAMSKMFEGCSKLEIIKGLSNFVTDNVIFMNFMFCGCKKLEFLGLEKFNTSKVQYFTGMFMDCINLKKLNLYHFEVLSANVDLMFQNVNQNKCELIANDEIIKKLFYKLRIIPGKGLSDRDIPFN